MYNIYVKYIASVGAVMLQVEGSSKFISCEEDTAGRIQRTWNLQLTILPGV